MWWVSVLSLGLSILITIIIVPALKFVIEIKKELVELRLIIKDEVHKATKETIEKYVTKEYCNKCEQRLWVAIKEKREYEKAKN